MGSGVALELILLTGGAAAASFATCNKDFYHTKDRGIGSKLFKAS